MLNCSNNINFQGTAKIFCYNGNDKKHNELSEAIKRRQADIKALPDQFELAFREKSSSFIRTCVDVYYNEAENKPSGQLKQYKFFNICNSMRKPFESTSQFVNRVVDYLVQNKDQIVNDAQTTLNIKNNKGTIV